MARTPPLNATLYSLNLMEASEPLIVLQSFSLQEHDVADNLVTFLNENQIEAIRMRPQRDDSATEGEELAVFVSQGDERRARDLMHLSFQNYDRHLEALTESQSRVPLSTRLLGYLVGFGIPGYILAVSIHSLWRAVSQNPTLGSPMETDLGTGIMGTIVGTGWLIGAIALWRKRAV